MLIPVEFETAEAFVARAADVLARAGTLIYVDTSFVMWLTAIGPESRAAFIDWASMLGGRIRVPAWTVQEYYRHHQSGTLMRDTADKCLAAGNALDDLASHMRVYADGPLLPDQPGADFGRELGEVSRRLGELTAAARAWDHDAASREVIGWMNAHALARTRTFASFANLGRRGRQRYSHTVPPGFEDAHKTENRFGDLLFWDDVIADARRETATRVAVLTRDRKKDWFLQKPQADVGEGLKKLKGRWDPVPAPHPMLSFELRSRAKAELLLIDEAYLGAVLWSLDRQRFGRFAAVAFGMGATRLTAQRNPPPSAALRATKRAAADTISAIAALRVLKAAKAGAESEALRGLLGRMAEAPPAFQAFLDENCRDAVAELKPEDAAVLARLLHRGADGDPQMAAFGRTILDGLDSFDAEHASAVLGGILVAAYYDGGGVPRDRPVGALLQEGLEWRTDMGVRRMLDQIAGDLRRLHSTALFLPSASTTPVEVRLEPSTAHATTPMALGQLYLGAQAVLTDASPDASLAVSATFKGAGRATVRSLAHAAARHFGVPLDLVSIVDADPEEPRTILADTAFERFDAGRPPIRIGEAAHRGTEGMSSGTAAGDDRGQGGPLFGAGVGPDGTAGDADPSAHDTDDGDLGDGDEMDEYEEYSS